MKNGFASQDGVSAPETADICRFQRANSAFQVRCGSAGSLSFRTPGESRV